MTQNDANVWYDSYETIPPDAIMQAGLEFQNDTRPNKVNAGIGMILDSSTGKPFVPPVVQSVAQDIGLYDAGYLPSHGHNGYLEAHARELVFGPELWSKMGGVNGGRKPDNFVWAQTLGGTKALNLAATLLKLNMATGERNLLLDKGWPNYFRIFDGFTITEYVHENPDTRQYNHDEYMKVLSNHPSFGYVLLQAGSYNDDGTERSIDQWKEIIEVIGARKLQPILDFAYNGLGNGWEIDNIPAQLLVKSGITTIFCVSNSKNFAYSARLGSLYIANIPKDKADAVQSTLANVIIRSDYSNPSAFPAQTFALVLNDATLRAQYKEQITEVRQNVLDFNRNTFARVLGLHWITKKRGMFFKLIPSGFSDTQVAFLKDENAIHGPKSSRINVGGFDPDKIEEIAGIYKKALEL